MTEEEVFKKAREQAEQGFEPQRELIEELYNIAVKYKEKSQREYERGFNAGQSSGARVWGS